jgi:hypothetical protein
LKLNPESRINFESTDVSVLSIESFDSLLLNESISVESEDSLLRHILKLGFGYRDLLRHIQVSFLSEDGLSLLSESFEIPPESVFEFSVERITNLPPSPLPPFDSQIISDIPEIFTEFRWKRFSLLWRGSRDGFGASEFHGRCDGHASTLTLICDTNGNIFGGFTPVEWESPPNCKDGRCKADDSLNSFLFMLKNPHNIPAKRFALKDEKKYGAICCDARYGPYFGDGFSSDMFVSDNCNTNTGSWTQLGRSYINDTELNNQIVFTGSLYFKVEEIEVFEITD